LDQAGERVEVLANNCTACRNCSG